MKKRFYSLIPIFLVAIFLMQMPYASKSFAMERKSEDYYDSVLFVPFEHIPAGSAPKTGPA